MASPMTDTGEEQERMDADRNALQGFEVLGLSISQCILAIVEGKVPEELVVRIEGGTCFEDLQELGRQYAEKYWKDLAGPALVVFNRLLAAGRISQPRLEGKEPPDTSKGIWRFGSLHLGTDELQDLLAISDAFLNMPAAGRDDFIDILPQAGLQELVLHLRQGRLAAFFPGYLERTTTLTAVQIFGLIRERLKEFFREGNPQHRATIYPALMQILGPSFRTYHVQSQQPTSGVDSRAPQHSRVGPPPPRPAKP